MQRKVNFKTLPSDDPLRNGTLTLRARRQTEFIIWIQKYSIIIKVNYNDQKNYPRIL